MAVQETIDAMHAVVTLDVALPGIVWPWFVTMNLWAKSVGTGVLLIGFYLFKRYKNEDAVQNFKLPLVIISFVFLNLFLLFTLADLHQPFRMWHIFFYPHWSSPITYGAFMATALLVLVTVLVYAAWFKKDELFNKLWLTTVLLAIPVTVYSAFLFGIQTSREFWQVPTEIVQMVLAATLAGSATLLLVGKRFSDGVNKDLAMILAFSAISAFTIYMGEYLFGPDKAEEIRVVLAAVQGGSWTGLYWTGMLLAFVIPSILSVTSIVTKNRTILLPAAVSALVGLWIAKHVWLSIPQLLPMS